MDIVRVDREQVSRGIPFVNLEELGAALLQFDRMAGSEMHPVRRDLVLTHGVMAYDLTEPQPLPQADPQSFVGQLLQEMEKKFETWWHFYRDCGYTLSNPNFLQASLTAEKVEEDPYRYLLSITAGGGYGPEQRLANYLEVERGLQSDILNLILKPRSDNSFEINLEQLVRRLCPTANDVSTRASNIVQAMQKREQELRIWPTNIADIIYPDWETKKFSIKLFVKNVGHFKMRDKSGYGWMQLWSFEEGSVVTGPLKLDMSKEEAEVFEEPVLEIRVSPFRESGPYPDHYPALVPESRKIITDQVDLLQERLQAA